LLTIISIRSPKLGLPEVAKLSHPVQIHVKVLDFERPTHQQPDFAHAALDGKVS
jgi:hypothetical protein